MRIVLSGRIVVLIFLAGTLAHAAEPLMLYDDCNAPQIDQDKWVREEEGAGTEPIVQIQDHRLHLFNRSYSKTDSDQGKGEGSLFLTFANSAAVTAIQATVQVNDVRATGCPSNPEDTYAVTFLGGSFFNAATATPGSALHDVWAIIGLVRGSDMNLPTDVLLAVSIVGHCTNADCKDSTWLHSRDLGSVRRGEMATLRVQWHRDTHRFIFQRDDDLEVFVPYTLSDTAPPGRQRKGLRISYEAANCTPPSQPVTFIEAVFDDVLVNASAARAAGR
ncbi:MAG: hypothetical protein ACRERE_34290 [Candidatus Entotheonellia bacterium]